MYHSIIISDRNTWDYWHLIPSSRPLVNPPEAKIQIIEVPGSTDSFVDMTDLLTGSVMYGSRQGSWPFIVHPDWCDKPSWTVRYQDIMQYLHGKNHKIILEDDPYYYYEGRLKLNGWQTGANWSTIAIDYVFKPYKKSIHETKVILSGEAVDDPPTYYSISKTVKLTVGDEAVVPVFTLDNSNGETIVTFNDQTYTLVEGENKFKQIKLTRSSNEITVNSTVMGAVNVTISYRNGWL